MRLSAKISVDGVESVVVARPVDIVKWEAGTKRKITDGMGYSDMLQIIHSAAKREGLTDLSFNDWAATLEDFSPEAQGADPTQTAPSTDT
jgi:hypothetical protein